MGVVGLDDLSLDLAASLIRSSYAVKAFEVYFDYFSLVSIFFLGFDGVDFFYVRVMV